MRPLVLLDWSLLAYTPTGRLSEASPVEGGGDVYRLLTSVWRTVVLYDGVDSEEMFTTWLRREGFKGHVGLLCMPLFDSTAPMNWKLMQLRRLRTEGNVELLVVAADPHFVAGALADGVPSMLVTFPTYVSPDWRPDAERTPRVWEELTAEIDRQREARNSADLLWRSGEGEG